MVDRTESSPLREQPLYAVWRTMQARCFNPNNHKYSRYGGRGITVCERWRTSFAAFIADMGERPSNKHSIERINNDGNYEPGNCRWATAKEQANNRSRRPLPDMCGAGRGPHEMVGANVVLRKDGRTICRECKRDWYHKTKAKHGLSHLPKGWKVSR